MITLNQYLSFGGIFASKNTLVTLRDDKYSGGIALL